MSVINQANFKQCYWRKVELIAYCRDQGLSTQGSKVELIERITLFLETGKRERPIRQTVALHEWDSVRAPITRETPVMYYKSDPLTRAFFCKEIGPHFRFNADVLSWIKAKLS